jgi:hypothetical protein
MKKIKSEDPYLKKKIMVLPPTDLSGLQAGKAANITEDLVKILKQSEQLLLHTTPKGLALPEEITAPKFGVTYFRPEIAKIAKDKNMNALLAAFLPPIEHSQKRAGIWPFRYDAEVYKISMVINVIDVTNGCLYLTKFSSKEIVFPADDIEDLNKEEILNQAATKGLPEILEHQATAVIKELSSEPWTGRVLEKRNGLLMISGGKDVGVLTGQLFTVYGSGESIITHTGRTVQLLGKKVGQIKVASVLEEHSLAAPENAGNFFKDQTIIFYPEDNKK